MLWTAAARRHGPDRGKIPYPLIVKPVNLGSSVGIFQGGGIGGDQAGVDTALGFPAQVLVPAGRTCGNQLRGARGCRRWGGLGVRRGAGGVR